MKNFFISEVTMVLIYNPWGYNFEVTLGSKNLNIVKEREGGYIALAEKLLNVKCPALIFVMHLFTEMLWNVK